MVVQQGKLGATDTTVNMENFYSDAVATRLSDVDRIVENGTQYVRLVLQRPQPNFSRSGNSGAPTTTFNAPQYIDGLFTPNPTGGTNLIVIGFGIPVATTTIIIYSVEEIDDEIAKWTISTSLTNDAAQFSSPSFEAAITDIQSELVFASTQIKYTITVTSPPIDSTDVGLPFWRIVHDDAGAFDDVTEVQIIEPLVPKMSFFDTDGGLASTVEFGEENILDACFSTPDSAFFSIRFNDSGVGTTALDPSDDFSEAAAGAAAGSNDFNPARWNESADNDAFLRLAEKLNFSVAKNGQLETTYTLDDNYTVEIDAFPTTLDAEPKWFALRLLDSNNIVVASEGIGIETSPTTSGVFFASFLDNIANFTSSCEIREIRPLWHNTASGTDSFEVTFSGGAWVVSGTQTGLLANATTGVLYNETTDVSTPLEFLISCSANPTPGERFTFDLVTHNTKKEPLASGTLGITVTGTGFHTTNNVLTDLATYSIPIEPLRIELFGNTNGVISLTADDYLVTTTGEPIFPNIPVFTVEKVNQTTGLVIGSPLIEALDIISDPSKTYNDFLDGRVQIACTSSGSAGGGFVYIKIDNVLYKYPNNIALGNEDGGSATASTTAQIEKDGTNSLAWTRDPGAFGLPFLTYVEYDETSDQAELKTLDNNTLVNTSASKRIFLDISDYGTNSYRVFYDQTEGGGINPSFTALYYVDSSFNLQLFDVDDRISAFMAVNADDITLPAGTAQQTFVTAEVINAWGEALAGKDVTFTVTAGDGAVSPSTDTTTTSGIAETQFTVGSTVGTSTVTATVTEL